MKIKMFGRYSVSSVFFLVSIFCFLVVLSLFLATLFLDLFRAFTALNSIPKIIMFFVPKMIFFYLLILIFKSFKSHTIFTKKTIYFLQAFTSINFLMALIVIVSSKFEGFWAEEVIPVVPLIILGIFSAFIAAIFNQGFRIQQENDLTI